MLTKKDLIIVEEIVDRTMKKRFEEFYFSIFEPFATRNEKAHEDIEQRFELKLKKLELKLDKGFQEIKEDIGEYIKDHEKRIRKLEIKTNL